MTEARAVEILQNEKACVLKANACGRNCAECDLVLPDAEIIEAYNMAIEKMIVDYKIPQSYVSIDRVLEIIKKRIEWCREQYNRGEHVADVYALALAREDILALKGEQE